MDGIINWIGGLLGSLPAWIFWPVFIILMIGIAVFWLIGEGVAFLPNRRSYLGEKKEKNKNGEK